MASVSPSKRAYHIELGLTQREIDNILRKQRRHEFYAYLWGLVYWFFVGLFSYTLSGYFLKLLWMVDTNNSSFDFNILTLQHLSSSLLVLWFCAGMYLGVNKYCKICHEYSPREKNKAKICEFWMAQVYLVFYLFIFVLILEVFALAFS